MNPEEEEWDVPKLEDLETMSKEEVHALSVSSRTALESVVSMPEAAKSEKYNVKAVERLEKAAAACRETERLLAEMPPAPDVDPSRLSGYVAEASRLLEGGLLAQNDEAWRDTLGRLRQIGKEISASEKAIATHQSELRKIEDAFRSADSVDDALHARARSVFLELIQKAGVDWRLTASTRSKRPIDQDLADQVGRAEEDFVTKTALDSENEEKRDSIEKASEALLSRIRDMKQAGWLSSSKEALRQRDVLSFAISDMARERFVPDDQAKRDGMMYGTGVFAERAEELGKKREALAVRRSGLEGAFLGKLRHGGEIEDLKFQIANLDTEISKNQENVERFAKEEKSKERDIEARAALRGVDLD